MIKDSFRKRGNRGRGARDAASQWFEENRERLGHFADNEYLRQYLFEPFNDLLTSFGDTTEGQVKATITQVALANAVLAALPGKLGVGVFVAMGLELWMAYRIASHVGIRLEGPGDLYRYIGVVTGVVATVLFLFVHILRGFFSLLSALPVDLPATFGAELLATNFVGILFWLAFEAVHSGGNLGKRLVIKLVPEAYKKTKALFRYQWEAIKHVASPANLKLIGQRLRNFLTGERPPPDAAHRRGELFASAGVAALVQGQVEAFDGPLGDIFLQAVRDRWSEVGENASAADIAEFFRAKEYTPEQLEGVVNTIKGKMFEYLVVQHENADGDEWAAHLHDDESFPGSDVVMTNSATGQEIEISLKTTDNPALIENALLRYPDIPIITTSEVAGEFTGEHRVTPSEGSNEQLDRIARENLESMAADAAPDRLDAVEGIAVGVTAVRFVLLWPYVARYLCGKSDLDELKSGLQGELGDAGMALAERIALTAALGPIYVWYLLARAVIELTPVVPEDAPPLLRLEHIGGDFPRAARAV